MKTRWMYPAHLLFPLVFLALAGCGPNPGTRNAPAPETATGGAGNSSAIPTWTLPPQRMPTPTSTETVTPSFTPTPALSAIAISAGRRHTCVLTDKGIVKCWGENEDGQLGDGTTIRKSTAVGVLGLHEHAEPILNIKAGFNHTCVLTSSGNVKCWGNNAFGQLGDGTQTSRSTPVEAPLPDYAEIVSAGTLHTCAATNGGLYCWGIVGYQFLNGEDVVNIAFKPYLIDTSNIPAEEQILSIQSGSDFDCLLMVSGSVYCWGRNDRGQLGRGRKSYSSNVPEKVVGLTGRVEWLVLGGYHACARIEGGTVQCWGDNKYGQLGRGTLGSNADASSYKVGEVPGLHDVSDISAGAYHTCVLLVDGRAKCWGDSRFGQLGGLLLAPNRFVDVTGVPDNLQWIAAGASHTCALTAAGVVVCWGNNKYGQLGDYAAVPAPLQTPMSTQTTGSETKPATLTPSRTPSLGNLASAVAAGWKHTCVATGEGEVKCWGNNEHGELGNGTVRSSSVPVDVTGVGGVVSIVAGWGHTCALTSAGGVKCWGYNKNGELGNGKTANSSTPVDVVGLTSGVIAIEAGDDHTCAVLAGGGVKCWGYNEYGQLGDGTTISRNIPVDVGGLIGKVTGVAAGWGHTCALTDAGAVKCWGNDEQGQLGDGMENQEYRPTPGSVSGLIYGVKAISADGGHTCVLATDGKVKCWGNNKYGQLGDGTAETRRIPVEVAGLGIEPVDIVVGWNTTCVLGSDGGLFCWGWNYYGQLGNGIRTTSTLPVEAGELVYGVTDVALGWGHTCAITDAGGVQCWGWNANGQIGDGSTSDAFLPVDVVGLKGGGS
jgi:alpha-tubulin suppressor-like RCC1 family protein